MEQNLEEPAAGYHCHCLRLPPDLACQDPGLICCLVSKDSPLHDEEEYLRMAKDRQCELRVLYDAGIDLAHYGRVDQLAPAGAMAEFVDYVQEQAREEAEEALAGLAQRAAQAGIAFSLHVVHGPEGVQELLARWARQAHKDASATSRG